MKILLILILSISIITNADWSYEEDQKLINLYELYKVNIIDISKINNRNIDEIKDRLIHLNVLIDDKNIILNRYIKMKKLDRQQIKQINQDYKEMAMVVSEILLEQNKRIERIEKFLSKKRVRLSNITLTKVEKS